MDVANTQQVFLGADHGGFELKELLKQRLLDSNYQVTDCGAFVHDGDDDYPKIALAVAQAVLSARTQGHPALGILLCRSSGGMTIAANKVSGIRAVSIDSIDSARHAREHNDAHIASISGDWTASTAVVEFVETFLNTPFSGEARHLRRLEQISAYEQSRS